MLELVYAIYIYIYMYGIYHTEKVFWSHNLQFALIMTHCIDRETNKWYKIRMRNGEKCIEYWTHDWKCYFYRDSIYDIVENWFSSIEIYDRLKTEQFFLIFIQYFFVYWITKDKNSFNQLIRIFVIIISMWNVSFWYNSIEFQSKTWIIQKYSNTR